MTFTIPDNDEAFNANQAIWMQTDINAIAAGISGDGVVSGCAVTAQGSPDMTVAVAVGVVKVGAAVASVAAGNVTITAADGTNPRIDLIVVSNAGVKSCTAGTAAANPKAPDIPASSVLLAMVYVPASDTTIATNQITDKRNILDSMFAMWHPVADADYTAIAGDRAIGYTSITAARTVTLPAASALNAGQELIIGDVSGSVTTAITITIARAGSDTINGATSYVISTPRGIVRLISDGSSKWYFDVVGPSRGGALREGRADGTSNAMLSIPGASLISVVSTAVANGRILYGPWRVYTTITIDQLVAELVTGVAAGEFRMGLYNADANLQPTTLIVDSGVINATVGDQGVKIFSTTQLLAPGLYVSALIGNSATLQFRTIRAGHSFLLPAVGASAFPQVLAKASTYGALAGTGVPWDTAITTDSSPMRHFVFAHVSVP